MANAICNQHNQQYAKPSRGALATHVVRVLHERRLAWLVRQPAGANRPMLIPAGRSQLVTPVFRY